MLKPTNAALANGDEALLSTSKLLSVQEGETKDEMVQPSGVGSGSSME
jgi:hypothetical protein